MALSIEIVSVATGLGALWRMPICTAMRFSVKPDALILANSVGSLI